MGAIWQIPGQYSPSSGSKSRRWVVANFIRDEALSSEHAAGARHEDPRSAGEAISLLSLEADL